MTRILRCAACTRRIKGHHPHIGLIALETSQELSYHARCQHRAAEDFAAVAERGKAPSLIWWRHAPGQLRFYQGEGLLR